MKSRRLVLACVGLILMGALMAPVPGTAQVADKDPGAFVTRLGNQTIDFLSDAAAPQHLREDRLRGLLRDGFAVERIGRFVLGKYRRTASEQSVDEFVDVFEDYIVALYAKQFSRFSGETFTVEQVVKTRRPKDSMVKTKIIPGGGGEALKVEFQVRNLGDEFKILDVRLEGVSMVLAQRDEFSAYIGNNGGKVEALTAALRKRLVTLTEPTARATTQ